MLAPAFLSAGHSEASLGTPKTRAKLQRNNADTHREERTETKSNALRKARSRRRMKNAKSMTRRKRKRTQRRRGNRRRSTRRKRRGRKHQTISCSPINWTNQLKLQDKPT